jgi:hypothetical protein
MYALVFIIKSVFVKGKQKDSVISFKNNKKD